MSNNYVVELCGAVFAGATLALYLSKEIIPTIWRRYRLRNPINLYFVVTSADKGTVDYVVQNDKEHFTTKLCVPSHRNDVYIQIQMDAKLAFTQHHIALSFENPNNVPTPPRIDHYKLQFIKIGDNEKWPGRDDGHWVDHHPVYHITEDRPRMARQKITYGFIIETGDTGEFPLTVELLADGVGITNHLDFQVEDRHRPSVKCTKHLDCWVLPNPLPQ